MQAIATGVPRLPLETWLQNPEALTGSGFRVRIAFLLTSGAWDQVQLHQDLAKDIEDKFGSVPQQDTGPRSLNQTKQPAAAQTSQANEVVQDVVMRIQSGAQQCVVGTPGPRPQASAGRTCQVLRRQQPQRIPSAQR